MSVDMPLTNTPVVGPCRYAQHSRTGTEQVTASALQRHDHHLRMMDQTLGMHRIDVPTRLIFDHLDEVVCMRVASPESVVCRQTRCAAVSISLNRLTPFHASSRAFFNNTALTATRIDVPDIASAPMAGCKYRPNDM